MDYSEVMRLFNEMDTGAKNRALRLTEITTYLDKKGIAYKKDKAAELFKKHDKSGQKGAGNADGQLQLDEFEGFINELLQ